MSEKEKKDPVLKGIVGFWHYGVILTYLSVVSAIVGGIFSVGLKMPYVGVACLMFSGICDGFDGMVAKTRKNRSKADKLFGERIDSLSDLVAFGVAPVMVGVGMGFTQWYMIVLYALFVLCALVRLAYFDVTEQIRMEDENCGKRKYYEGFPVTNSGFILPIFYVIAIMFEGIFWAQTLVMAIGYLGLGAAFVIRFKMPKFGAKGISIAIACSFITVITLLLIKFLVLK